MVYLCTLDKLCRGGSAFRRFFVKRVCLLARHQDFIDNRIEWEDLHADATDADVDERVWAILVYVGLFLDCWDDADFYLEHAGDEWRWRWRASRARSTPRTRRLLSIAQQ